MIKLTFCLVRLPHLSRAQFQKYWFETHAPLVASVAETLQIRRYVQLHSLPAEAHAALRESRQAPAEFDGVAELWFDSLEALAEGDVGESAPSAVSEDQMIEVAGYVNSRNQIIAAMAALLAVSIVTNVLMFVGR